jgi:osmotically inducible protein OsmC
MRMAIRTAKAEWTGTIMEGKGTMALGSGAWQGPYSFASRFEDGQGTNPEELIAAAHAGCFSMALSGQLSKAGFKPTRIATTASVQLLKQEAGFAITRIELQCEAQVPGIDDAKFQELAAAAKQGCPVSKALASVEITLNAKLIAS